MPRFDVSTERGRLLLEEAPGELRTVKQSALEQLNQERPAGLRLYAPYDVGLPVIGGLLEELT